MTDKSINKSEQYEVQTIEPPYDDYENALLQQIDSIKRAYEEQIRPLVQRLADSRSYKTPKVIVIPKKSNQ